MRGNLLDPAARIVPLLLFSLFAACGEDDPAGIGDKDVTPPAVVGDLRVTGRAAASLDLAWTAPGDDGNSGTPFQYGIRYSFSDNVTDANWAALAQAVDEPIPSAAGSAETYTLTGLIPGVVYFIGLKSRDEVETNWSPISNVVVDSTLAEGDSIPPAAITDLSLLRATSSSITLAWTATGDDADSGNAASYDLRFAPDSAAVASWDPASRVIGEPNPGGAGETDSMEVAGLLAGRTYFFGLRAFDWAGNGSATSNILRAATAPAGDVTPPGYVADLVVAALTCSSVTLSWTAPGDDGDQGTATSYDVRYALFEPNVSNWKDAEAAEGEPVPSHAGSDESFTVVGLGEGARYYFALKAFDEGANESPLSAVADTTTPPCPDPAP
ncbi:MAG: fibronectin type III domain-containing protein [Candidatus Eisenbacteria bacterium]